MPFGDSVTASYLPYSGYRCDLHLLLRAANINYIYCGSKIVDSYGNPPPQCGGQAPGFYLSHEGYSGWAAADFLDPTKDNYIEKILDRKIYMTDKANIPQIVLMHLGTNDLNQHHPVPQIISDIGSLIDHFRGRNPAVGVLVAQIIPCSGLDWCGDVPVLNAAIPALAAQKNTLSSPVMVVDMYSDYDPLVDNDAQSGTYVHPNFSGGAKMAARWMAAIQRWLNRPTHQVFIPVVKNF